MEAPTETQEAPEKLKELEGLDGLDDPYQIVPEIHKMFNPLKANIVVRELLMALIAEVTKLLEKEEATSPIRLRLRNTSNRLADATLVVYSTPNPNEIINLLIEAFTIASPPGDLPLSKLVGRKMIQHVFDLPSLRAA